LRLTIHKNLLEDVMEEANWLQCFACRDQGVDSRQRSGEGSEPHQPDIDDVPFVT
jgi:hypothetical protein